jgi:hypothetical protein
MRPSRFLVPGLAVASFAVLGQYISRHAPNRFTPVVRCSQGHLYQSVWIPGGSLKGVRWFKGRLQWCPVGRHWSWTRRVGANQISADERTAANEVHDLPIP